jgi:tetracycline resistance efflux pump
VWRAIDDSGIIMPWVTHQQRVPMAFFAFRPQAKHTMLTHKLNKHKFTGKEKKMRNKRKMGYVFLMSLLILCCSSTTVFAADTSAEYVPQLYATIWSLVPPVVAIVLALITKEVYSSLFVGILIGGAFWSGFKAEATILHVFQDGVVGVLTDSYNMGILVFLVILGVMVCMMNKAGGSAAFGRWAKEHIKTRAGAQLATIALGVLIFIDDYFNCLTVGSVMRPVTDSHNVSRAKLAYLIDATAAPICIIAPISSWAAAVTGFVKGEDGFSIFIRAIPYNYYAILTIIMMVTLVLAKEDYGPMKAHEKNAIEGDLFTTGDRPFENATENAIYNKGKVIDLVFPILSLIVCCVIGMIYSGGFFSGTGFVEAFSGSDASVGLMLGSFFAMVITIVFYAVRKVLRFSDSMACIPEGFKAMVPAILILTFAWTLKAMTDSLGAAPFVASVMNSAAGGLMNLLPAIIFLVGCFLAFATGTSWGTFGILIPIVVAVFQGTNETMMIISISACMAGAVCGDHCSPISDTTIMASAGAQCNHVNHVSTQLPYAMTVAAVSCVTYMIAGIVQNAIICLVIGIALQIGVLLAIKAITKDHTGRVKTTN